MRSLTATFSFSDVGPKLLPPEFAASYPFAPAAEGRGWKYPGALKGCPINADPPVPEGFLLEGHEVVLHGQCPACHKPAARRTRKPR